MGHRLLFVEAANSFIKAWYKNKGQFCSYYQEVIAIDWFYIIKLCKYIFFNSVPDKDKNKSKKKNGVKQLSFVICVYLFINLH